MFTWRVSTQLLCLLLWLEISLVRVHRHGCQFSWNPGGAVLCIFKETHSITALFFSCEPSEGFKALWQYIGITMLLNGIFFKFLPKPDHQYLDLRDSKNFEKQICLPEWQCELDWRMVSSQLRSPGDKNHTAPPPIQFPLYNLPLQQAARSWWCKVKNRGKHVFRPLLMVSEKHVDAFFFYIKLKDYRWCFYVRFLQTKQITLTTKSVSW